MASHAETIAETKAKVERSKTDLLTTFAHVPDDKLSWSPGGAARSALWLVGHCGVASEAFATFLSGGTLSLPADPEELTIALRDGGKATASRDEAIRLVEDSHRKVLAALDTVTKERLAGTSQTPFGPMPFSIWLDASWAHAYSHARQLDYLQTIWGDIQDHR